MSPFDADLKIALKENALTFALPVVAQLSQFLTLMQTWNRVFNLTTITTPRDMVYLHLIDSLVIQPYLIGTHCLDVGTGAGLPGLPLAIATPEQQWVLLDKNGKKTRFLTQVVAELGLKNVQIVQERCEDFHPALSFDNILSRAFGTLALFIETTTHLLAKEGQWLAMKGKYPQDELAAIRQACYQIDTKALAIKGMDVERHIVFMRKGKP